MNQPKGFLHARKRRFVAISSVGALALFAWHFYAYGQDKSQFPEGYDAVQAAPDTHKVIFENEFVRVLEVTVPPPETPYRCITTVGLVSFWIGTPAARLRTFVIIARMAPSQTIQATKNRLMRVLGACTG